MRRAIDLVVLLAIMALLLVAMRWVFLGGLMG